MSPNSPKKKASYAELIGGKKIEVRLEKKPPIKPIAKHTISGKPTVRTDARAKVTGEAVFTGDIRLPGMLYAAILRPPAHGAKLKSADTSAAEKFPGAQVVRDGDLVAVLHEKPDLAAAALALVEAEFDPSPSKLDNTNIFAHLREAAPRAEVVVESGNLDEGAKLAAKTVERSYYAHYVAHAPSEPHTAVVRIEGGKAEVWASTQSPFRARQEIARTLGLPEADVRVRTPFVGCGFGGKNQGGQIVEAARLAKLSGRPVQVAWTRKEEFFNDTFRPAAVYDVRSGLDAANRIVLWDYKNLHAGSRSSQPVYDIPHKRVLSYGSGFGGSGGGGVQAHPFGTGAWRGPGSNTNIFATECHIDIMAEAAGMDPLSFRLLNLADARMKKVVQAAADKFGRTFATAPTGRGYGIAITDYLGTYVATMAEVAVDKTKGTVRVLRVVCAQDTGEVVNPEGARMQIEGCITMGLGYCLTEEIRFANGAVLDENYDTYELPRFSWLPKIEVVLVDNPDLGPSGCGEPAVTVMGAVVANAIHDAVGVRMFTLPMTPARILEALSPKREAYFFVPPSRYETVNVTSQADLSKGPKTSQKSDSAFFECSRTAASSVSRSRPTPAPKQIPESQGDVPPSFRSDSAVKKPALNGSATPPNRRRYSAPTRASKERSGTIQSSPPYSCSDILHSAETVQLSPGLTASPNPSSSGQWMVYSWELELWFPYVSPYENVHAPSDWSV